jgi:hypothetical protein
MRRNLVLTVALAAALAVGFAAIAPSAPKAVCVDTASVSASSSCAPRLVVAIHGQATPEELPRHLMAPIALRMGGKVSTTNGSQPTALREVKVDFDKGGTVNAKGLPVCNKGQLVASDIVVVRRECRKSIVGTGEAHIAIKSLPQAPISVPLTLFNGGVRDGVTTVFVQAAPTAALPMPMVATVRLSKAVNSEGSPKRGYGLQAVATIPAIAGEGSLLDFSFKVKRIFNYKGTQQSYAMASCPESELRANMGLAFIDGTFISGDIVQPCTPGS